MLNWQEALVAVIVAGAVVSLYRHLRGMFATSQTPGDASSHGCDDSGDAVSYTHLTLPTSDLV